MRNLKSRLNLENFLIKTELQNQLIKGSTNYIYSIVFVWYCFCFMIQTWQYKFWQEKKKEQEIYLRKPGLIDLSVN
jgi:membrane protein YdbS with pleckstrin-like domain